MMILPKPDLVLLWVISFTIAWNKNGWILNDMGHEIKAHMSERYGDLPQGELFEKLEPWLKNIKSNELADIIYNDQIEKYPEHKVKGWLGNGRDIIQVNGSIDLLYYKDNQWVILDYKTDRSKRFLPNYKLQLQSYQWILKQVYGIDAVAKIYFASLDETILIEWDDNYFNEIKLETDVRAELPPVSMDLVELIPEIKAGKHMILCASAQHEEQVYLAMAKEGVLRPDIKISTLNKFVQESAADIISQDKLRLMIRYRNLNMKNGTADLLTKALRNEELQKGTIKNEFRDKFGSITSGPAYHSAAEPYLNAKAEGYRIILLDVHAETELEKSLIGRLASETELLSLSLSQDDPRETYTLLQAFSPREEVLACARHIKENCGQDDDILIAVASMEKYAPHLQRQFPQLGLRARFIGPRSLYELPCTNLLMKYLKLCANSATDWQALAPLLMPPAMKKNKQFFGFDKNVRQYPMEDRSLPQSGLHFCEKVSNLLKETKTFIKKIAINDNEESRKACDKFLEVLEKVIKDLIAIDPKADLSAIYREMIERIKNESILRRDQWNGIPVVGLLDSLGVQADKLYILGMVEGDIPRQEADNPFFIRNRDYTLELNKHFMNEWKKLGDKVIFCTSTHAEDGSEQNRSSFLEDMELDVIDKSVLSRREHLLSYSDHTISGNDSLLVERHHDILEVKKSQFSGDIDVKQQQFDISVTHVDTLLACPMKFYFEMVMKSRPMDQDEVLLWAGIKGDVVHKAYEYFIAGNGYALERGPAH